MLLYAINALIFLVNQIVKKSQMRNLRSNLKSIINFQNVQLLTLSSALWFIVTIGE